MCDGVGRGERGASVTAPHAMTLSMHAILLAPAACNDSHPLHAMIVPMHAMALTRGIAQCAEFANAIHRPAPCQVYQNNTCIARGAAGPGVDPYPYGAEGSGCDYTNATMQPVLLHLVGNRYLSPGASYAGACGLGLDGLKALGEEAGSSVGDAPAVGAMMELARRTLGLAMGRAHLAHASV
mgnify:CR=1 FL=1